MRWGVFRRFCDYLESDMGLIVDDTCNRPDSGQTTLLPLAWAVAMVAGAVSGIAAKTADPAIWMLVVVAMGR